MLPSFTLSSNLSPKYSLIFQVPQNVKIIWRITRHFDVLIISTDYFTVSTPLVANTSDFTSFRIHLLDTGSNFLYPHYFCYFPSELYSKTLHYFCCGLVVIITLYSKTKLKLTAHGLVRQNTKESWQS